MLRILTLLVWILALSGLILSGCSDDEPSEPDDNTNDQSQDTLFKIHLGLTHMTFDGRSSSDTIVQIFGFFHEYGEKDNWINPGDLAIDSLRCKFDSTDDTAPFLCYGESENIKTIDKEIFGRATYIGVTGNPETGVKETLIDVYAHDKIYIKNPKAYKNVYVEDGFTVEWNSLENPEYPVWIIVTTTLGETLINKTIPDTGGSFFISREYFSKTDVYSLSLHRYYQFTGFSNNILYDYYLAGKCERKIQVVLE